VFIAAHPPRPGSEPTRVERALHRHPRLGLTLLCLILWLPGFFLLPPTDRDEARFAQASRQMVETGDWVRIRVGEEERNKKPAGIHWAQATAVHALEATGLADRTEIWVYRLPSLLGAWLAVLATFQLGRSLVGRRASLLAGALLASSLVLVAEAHIAKTDAALLATVAIAMGLLGRAYLRPGGFTAREAAGFWLALGVGVLLKGPIGPLVALLTGVTLWIADRQAPWWRALRPEWGLPLMAAAAAPWFVAIGIATEGRFFTEAVGGDMLAKVGGGEEKHWGPPGYYAALFGILAFPGSFLVLLAAPSAWAQRLKPPTRFLLAWVVPTWLLFEAVSTKLPHYVLPTFPALFLIASAWALDPLREMPARWWRRVALAGPILVSAGLAIGGVTVGWVLVGPFGPMIVAWLALPVAVCLGLWTMEAVRAQAWALAGVVAAVAAAPLYMVLLEGVAPRLTPLWIAPRLAAALPPEVPARDVGVTGIAEPSLRFAIGTELVLLRDGPAAAAFLAAAPGRVAVVGDRATTAFATTAASMGLTVQAGDAVTGFNYSRGRWVTLTPYKVAP